MMIFGVYLLIRKLGPAGPMSLPLSGLRHAELR